MLRLALCMLVAATATARAEGTRALPPIPKTGPVTVIKIDKVVDLGLAPFIDRITSAGEPGDLLVLDINTLGGRIDAAIMIRDALLHTEARTVCWVNPRAISAGALIALACDVIAVAPGATLGAATPVQIGPSGEMTPVEAKVVSFMRSEMRATALAKGRRGDIAEAMVDADASVPGLAETASCSRSTATSPSRGGSPMSKPPTSRSCFAPSTARRRLRSRGRISRGPRTSRGCCPIRWSRAC